MSSQSWQKVLFNVWQKMKKHIWVGKRCQICHLWNLSVSVNHLIDLLWSALKAMPVAGKKSISLAKFDIIWLPALQQLLFLRLQSSVQCQSSMYKVFLLYIELFFNLGLIEDCCILAALFCSLTRKMLESSAHYLWYLFRVFLWAEKTRFFRRKSVFRIMNQISP